MKQTDKSSSSLENSFNLKKAIEQNEDNINEDYENNLTNEEKEPIPFQSEIIGKSLFNKFVTLAIAKNEENNRNLLIPSHCNKLTMNVIKDMLQVNNIFYDKDDIEVFNNNHLGYHDKVKLLNNQILYETHNFGLNSWKKVLQPNSIKIDNYCTSFVKIEQEYINEPNESLLARYRKRNTTKSKTISPIKKSIKHILGINKTVKNLGDFPNTSNAFNLKIFKDGISEHDNKDALSDSHVKKHVKKASYTEDFEIKLSSEVNNKQVKQRSSKNIIKNKIEEPYKMEFFEVENIGNISEDELQVKELRELKFKEIKQKEEEEKKRKIRLEQIQKQQELENQMKSYAFDPDKKAIDINGQLLVLKKLGNIDKNDFPVPKYELKVKRSQPLNTIQDLKSPKQRKVIIANQMKEKENKEQIELKTENNEEKGNLKKTDTSKSLISIGSKVRRKESVFSKINNKQSQQTVVDLGGNNYA